MTCYACTRRAVADCPRCRRHYCNAHGREVCRDCGAPTSGLPAQLTYRAVVLSSIALASLAVMYLQVWPTVPAPRPRAGLALNYPASASPADGEPAEGPTPPALAPLIESTPTPTATPVPAPTPTAPPPMQYTVESGDTLLGIALRHDTTVEAILQANGLTQAHQLSIGQTLTIPQEGSPTPTAIATPSPTPTARQALQYRVEAGDTLLGIALDHDTTVEAIIQANGLADAHELSIGQTLTIPRY